MIRCLLKEARTEDSVEFGTHLRKHARVNEEVKDVKNGAAGCTWPENRNSFM